MEIIDIGLYINGAKNSLDSKSNVLGEELLGEAICRALTKIKNVKSAVLYACNYLPDRKLDFMVYLNDTEPNTDWARRHILYMQNAYQEGSDLALRRFQKIKYDGYAFISKRLLNIHINDGYKGIYLPFGVDTDFFYPRAKDKSLSFEVAYVGNDKGQYRTTNYICPALNFDFGLFGNWYLSRRKTSPLRKLKFWKKRRPVPEYRKMLANVSRGKIPQEQVPILYSSANVNLNYTTQDSVDWGVITARTFDVLACKGFLISDKTSYAETLLKDCVVFTEGGDDLVEKIRYYINNPKKTEEIAQNGYEYVIKNGSIDSRAQELFNYMQEI